MKPGRVKNEFGLIGSPIYSSFHVVEFELCKYVVSFNGATRLIQGHELSSSGFLRAQRHFNRSKPFLYPLETETRIQVVTISVSPGPQFRDYCCRASA